MAVGGLLGELVVSVLLVFLPHCEAKGIHTPPPPVLEGHRSSNRIESAPVE